MKKTTQKQHCVCDKKGSGWKTDAGYAAHFMGKKHQMWAEIEERSNMESYILGRDFVKVSQQSRDPPSLFELSRLKVIHHKAFHQIPEMVNAKSHYLGPGITLCERYYSRLYPDHKCITGDLLIRACSRGDENLFYYIVNRILSSTENAKYKVFKMCRWLEVCTEAYCALKVGKSQVIVNMLEKFIPPKVITKAKMLSDIWTDDQPSLKLSPKVLSIAKRRTMCSVSFQKYVSDLYLLVACRRKKVGIIAQCECMTANSVIRNLSIRYLLESKFYPGITTFLRDFQRGFQSGDFVNIVAETLREGDEGFFGLISHLKVVDQFRPFEKHKPVPPSGISIEIVSAVTQYFMKLARDPKELFPFPIEVIRILRYVGLKFAMTKGNPPQFLGELIISANIVGDNQLARLLSCTRPQGEVDPSIQKHLLSPLKWHDDLDSKRIVDARAFLILFHFPHLYPTILERLSESINLQGALRISGILGNSKMIELILEKTGGTVDPKTILKRSRTPEKQKPNKKLRILGPENNP